MSPKKNEDESQAEMKQMEETNGSGKKDVVMEKPEEAKKAEVNAQEVTESNELKQKEKSTSESQNRNDLDKHKLEKATSIVSTLRNTQEHNKRANGGDYYACPCCRAEKRHRGHCHTPGCRALKREMRETQRGIFASLAEDAGTSEKFHRFKLNMSLEEAIARLPLALLDELRLVAEKANKLSTGRQDGNYLFSKFS